MIEIESDIHNIFLKLQGQDATFSASISFSKLNELRAYIESNDTDEVPSVPVHVLLSFDEMLGPNAGFNASQEVSISIWSDMIFDLLDLSICISHLAERSDTTEQLSDLYEKSRNLNGKENEVPFHKVQWMMCQSFFGCHIYLFSKNAHQFQGLRLLNFSLYDEHNHHQAMITSLSATPEALRIFSDQLRQCYEQIQHIMGAE